ncbi:FAD-dependent pyridine nucleotide-disulfide oxidoreductase [Thermincola ferriacetica]|uniref:FAD-dependent pyridine nucleotide-disulfide oxidoreductase n=1 Tax=Thermincola ferriacetica TaxID=281456 RepID=A0A0L6W6Q0_9FIRM|nr:FAD-dependent oxidoreductase [Thermincola ferriacetica]KNZ71048.1 FAD-dependent pyridine nucleotide-disulfide oxidoreductase [Thermincola ferriacetica]
MHNKRVLVIGGGTAGMAAALEAADQGLLVFLVEKNRDMGGWAYTYCCKATEKCNKCGTCLVLQLKGHVERHPLITVFCNSHVIGMTGRAGAYTVQIGTEQGEIKLDVAAIILATGFKPFNAALKGEFHYGKHPNVVTALELEQTLRTKGSVVRAFGEVRKIGFIQCVGSRDLALGNNYCSRVCCMYAAKLAKLLRAELPQAEISIFFMDLQTFGKGFDDFIKSCRSDDKIHFIRGIPAKIFSFPYDRLTVRYADSITGEAIEEKFDIIILSSAILPGEDTAKLAEIFGLETDEHGFFAVNPLNPVATNKEAVFVAGTCESPKDIPGSIEQGKAAAGAVVDFLCSTL